MQAREHLWATQMVLSCQTEHFLVDWDSEHNPRPRRPVHFSQIAADYLPSQAEEKCSFLVSEFMDRCTNN
jgi:hypothetical protein